MMSKKWCTVPIYKESQNSPESNEAWCVEFIRNSIGLNVMLLLNTYYSLHLGTPI